MTRNPTETPQQRRLKLAKQLEQAQEYLKEVQAKIDAIDEHGMPEPIDIVQDPDMSLVSWRAMIDGLLAEYGPNATLFTDAGPNNVSLRLRRTDNPNRR